MITCMSQWWTSGGKGAVAPPPNNFKLAKLCTRFISSATCFGTTLATGQYERFDKLDVYLRPLYSYFTYLFRIFITVIYTYDFNFVEQVYVSYYADSEEYHSSVLNLVAKLRSTYSINLIMDSYCQTEVAELGLARWCQKKLSESTKIVMVVSKEYRKVGSSSSSSSII